MPTVAVVVRRIDNAGEGEAVVGQFLADWPSGKAGEVPMLKLAWVFRQSIMLLNAKVMRLGFLVRLCRRGVRRE